MNTFEFFDMSAVVRLRPFWGTQRDESKEYAGAMTHLVSLSDDKKPSTPKPRRKVQNETALATAPNN